MGTNWQDFHSGFREPVWFLAPCGRQSMKEIAIFGPNWKYWNVAAHILKITMASSVLYPFVLNTFSACGSAKSCHMLDSFCYLMSLLTLPAKEPWWTSIIFHDMICFTSIICILGSGMLLASFLLEYCMDCLIYWMFHGEREISFERHICTLTENFRFCN